MTLTELMVVMVILALPVSLLNTSWEEYTERRRLTDSAALFQQYLSSQKLRANYLSDTRQIRMVTGAGSGTCHQTADSMPCQPDSSGFVPLSGVTFAAATTGIVTFWGVRHTASPASVVLSNKQGRIRLIISAPGRIRLCTPDNLPGVPSCG